MGDLFEFRRRAWVGALGLAWALVAAPVGAAEPAIDAETLATSPFAAHNAYPYRAYGPDRLSRALAAGLRFIEIDVTYDPSRKIAVATHDSVARGDEPELSAVLEPLWRQWGESDLPDLTLIIDFKTGSRELAAAVQQALAPHAAQLTKLRKAPGAPLEPGRITVCLTGSAEAHAAFDELTPAGEPYLAFADFGFGETAWKADSADYVPQDAPGFHRFLTFHGQNFMSEPRGRGSEQISQPRMAALIERAGPAGYRVRVYTINPKRAADGSRDTTYWQRAADAGMHMISTDDYEDAQAWWQAHRANGAPK